MGTIFQTCAQAVLDRQPQPEKGSAAKNDEVGAAVSSSCALSFHGSRLLCCQLVSVVGDVSF